MELFNKRKRSHSGDCHIADVSEAADDEPTEIKLALLASLHPDEESEILLEALLASDGCVQAASAQLSGAHSAAFPPKKRQGTASVPRQQSSLPTFNPGDGLVSPRKAPTKRGKTLHLFSPEDIAAHTPCSIIHNFLDPEQANKLLEELLAESTTFRKDKFRLFDNVVASPHTMAFYVDDHDAAQRQKEYVYNGARVEDVRQTPPEMLKVSAVVGAAVNKEVQKRIQSHYPGGKKLKYQSPKDWKPNAAIVNCYDGGRENVGYHSDSLTYIGPRAIIGSLSLGVAREFRVRQVIPRNTQFDPNDKAAKKANMDRADTEGQISIHLPHNSLLVMHAEMQEEWKHSIAPALAIDPHPIAKKKRINVTYRYYRESFHPKYTPRCKCNVAATLRCSQRKQESRGRYMWMCHAGYNPEYKQGCNFFQWAEFDDNGEPPWASGKQEADQGSKDAFGENWLSSLR